MTGSTDVYALPFPEDTDLVTEGDNAIQALALRLGTILAPAYLNTAHIDGSIQKAAAGGVNVMFGGVDQTGHFTVANDNSVIAYQGPARPFAITATVSLNLTAGGSGLARLFINSLVVRVAQSPPGVAGGAANRFTGTLSWSGTLVPGDVIGAAVVGPDTADIAFPALSIHSIGPATA